ncbi:hypothetical protein [Vibrio sinensis]|uniref:hypothetical protein n=1 Tax=Vibrio sinensis TaxID=2302434 RepID=UPI001A9DB79C|nr:hypothetical protein [Vibrio sinensis]
MKTKTTSIHITAHQLAIGMTIRCPIEKDEIIITDLIANNEESFGLGCHKGYTTLKVSDTFELIKPFDLTTVNLNWIEEQLTENAESQKNNGIMTLLWETESSTDKGIIEFTPYVLNQITYEHIKNTEPFTLKGQAVVDFFSFLENNYNAANLIANKGDLQCNSQMEDGTEILSSLIEIDDFISTLTPLLTEADRIKFNQWCSLGCQYVNIDFLKKKPPIASTCPLPLDAKIPHIQPTIEDFDSWFEAQLNQSGHPPLPHDFDIYLGIIMKDFVKQSLDNQTLRDYFDNTVHQGLPHNCGSRPQTSRKTCPLCKEFFLQSMVISRLSEIDSVLRATS